MDLASLWPLSLGAEVRDDLIAAYAESGRGYHDGRHLTEVLSRLEELQEHAAFDHPSVILAAWFHDGVYDGQPDDEERSATWAESSLPSCGVEDEVVAEVSRLVRLTSHHRPVASDRNGCALSDADLAILASSPSRYSEYARAVRQEYAHVSEVLFRAGRTAILGDLLAKPTLFHTEYAIDNWEVTARANVSAELDRLAVDQ
jgi:predicted metal-dependent HD superfamily phosphohydrolase